MQFGVVSYADIIRGEKIVDLQAEVARQRKTVGQVDIGSGRLLKVAKIPRLPRPTAAQSRAVTNADAARPIEVQVPGGEQRLVRV